MADKPTGKQLGYLRALAERTGTTFQPAGGRGQPPPAARTDSAAVRPAEVSGYGSNCRWRGREETR